MNVVGFERRDIERLLGLLGARLRRRGTHASVYVVGGAAIALTVVDGRRTIDVDALVSDRVVVEEARLLADDEGIPPTWLNEGARPWIPPRPDSAADLSIVPGLAVACAPPDHLLAMKLVAMRPQDRPDIIALANRLGLGDEADEYADLLERVYEGEGVLEQLLNVGEAGLRSEQMHRGGIAAAIVRAHRGAAPAGPNEDGDLT